MSPSSPPEGWVLEAIEEALPDLLVVTGLGFLQGTTTAGELAKGLAEAVLAAAPPAPLAGEGDSDLRTKIVDALRGCDLRNKDAALSKASEVLALVGGRERELEEAAQAVVDRWDSQLWKVQEPTAAVINRLRQALTRGAS